MTNMGSKVTGNAVIGKVRMIMAEYKRLKRDLVAKGVIIDYYQDTMLIPNGNTAKWDLIDHKGAAAVVAVRDDGKLLMVRQYRNALERDLNERQGNGAEYYLIADLNNLKTVNDTLGHSAGDALLQGFAQLLADAVGANGRVYRQGGDEFAVLYDGDAQRLIKNLDERCEAYNQSCDVPLSYAIGCCRTAEEGFRDVADQMMYEDKRRKKAAKALKSGSL